MWHIGIDLHRKTAVLAAVEDDGRVTAPITIACQEPDEIVQFVKKLTPFRAVIEASGTYRWLYDLLSDHGSVLLAHPSNLRALVNRRSKTDKLDAQLLANLLRIDQIPLAYVPPLEYQQLRDITRLRCRLRRQQSRIKIDLRTLLARHNRVAAYKYPFGPRGLAWFAKEDFGAIDNFLRDELLERFAHYKRRVQLLDQELKRLALEFPQTKVLMELRGIALYSALVIVGELGDPDRFRSAKQVGAYAGLTTRVNQSGGHCYHGHITRQGSPWLRWILVEASLHVIREDVALKNFYHRIRKRSSGKIARVAVARKLAEICWKRLRYWHGVPVAA
jgi:transposase